MFLFHYGKHQQMGGNKGPRTSALPINVLKRGPITYYSINFNQHKNFDDFSSSGIVHAFLESAYKIYCPTKENKFQGMLKLLISKEGKLFQKISEFG